MKVMRALIGFCLAVQTVMAQAPITFTIDPAAHLAAPVPADFSGLSFELSNLLPEPDGGHLLSADNQPLVTLFRTLGIRSLRVGGGTADMAKYAMPSEKDVDHLF